MGIFNKLLSRLKQNKTMEGVETESRNQAGPENLLVELGLIMGVAILCVIFFILYISYTKVEPTPKEYFMKNRIPLIKKVLKNKRDIQKLKKARKEEEEQ